MDATEAVSQAPALLSLGGRSFVILPPTPRDKLVTHQRMRALAESRDKSPLDYAAAHTHLPPAIFAVAVAEAIRIGHRPAPAPAPEVIWDQYTTLEGVRWRVWHHVSRVLKEFKIEEVRDLVTEDNLYDVSDALDAALRLGVIDPNAPAPATGSSS